jgi:hypothetical protein
MTIEWDHGTPLTWPEHLQTASASLIPGMLEALGDLPPGDRNFPARRLGLSSRLVADSIAQLGPEKTRSLLQPLLPIVNRAVEETRKMNHARVIDHGIGMCSLLNALECIGISVDPSPPAALIAEWTRTLVSKPKELVLVDEPLTAAFACVAMGLHTPIPALLRKKKLPSKFRPGLSFYDDLKGYVGYLALALEQDRPAKDVEMALRTVVWSTPTLHREGLVSWNDLLWAARIHFHTFEKCPVADVGDALYAFVRTKL